jgi:hypothetical protein
VSASAELPTPEAGRRRRTRNAAAAVERNALLTHAAAAALTILLLAEGVTLLDMHGLLRPHMFVGLMLIPPVLLKLASTGYRFARYYTGAAAYREKGPPRPLLRMLAPVLVASTATIFASGVWLLLLGHHSDFALAVHKVAFIAWSGVFGLHFLAYLPAAARSLAGTVVASRAGARVAGSKVATALVLGSVGVGLAGAVALLPRIAEWQGYRF